MSNAIAERPLVREIRHLVPPTLIFLLVFNLLALTVSLSQPTGGIIVINYATASVAALICGKAVLLADKVPFFNRFPDRPLIWNAAWKAGLYVVIAMLIRIVEHLIRAATSDYGFSAGVAHAADEFNLTRFVVIALWLAVLFLGYSAFAELVGVLGKDRMRQLFFGPVEPRVRRQPEAPGA